tara:strand:- start:474 stop:806 length:333 start_codon:yes stop_codon:yes gene_type:complete
LADVLLNRPADSAGHDILLNTSRELLMVSDSAGLSVITGGVDSSLLLIATGDSINYSGILSRVVATSGGADQSELDSANNLIIALRASLDSAETAAENAGSGGSTQRWIS